MKLLNAIYSDRYSAVLSKEVILVLAWTEKVGMGTRAEIAAGISLPANVVDDAISKLLKNFLIRETDGLLQVSVSGKPLLDAFDITEDIFEEHFPPAAMAALKEVEASWLYSLIKDYREHYYDNYLYTLLLLKLWKWLRPLFNSGYNCSTYIIECNLLILLHAILQHELPAQQFESYLPALPGKNIEHSPEQKIIFPDEAGAGKSISLKFLFTRIENNTLKPVEQFINNIDIFFHHPHFRMRYLFEMKHYEKDSVSENLLPIYKYFYAQLSGKTFIRNCQAICYLNQRHPVHAVTLRTEFDPDISANNQASGIPQHYLNLIMPHSRVYYEANDNCDIISQAITLRNFSVYCHEVFAHEPVQIRSFIHRPACMLQVTQYAGINEEPIGAAEFLFRQNDPEQTGSLPKGSYYLSFHINISPRDLVALSKKNPALTVVARKTASWMMGLETERRAFPTNKLLVYLVRSIMSCRYIDRHADLFMHRACLDLFLNMAMQEKWAAGRKQMRLTPRERESLHEIFTRAQTDISLLTDIPKLTAQYQLTRYKLKNGFIQEFGITLKDYNILLRMQLAYRILLKTNAGIGEIAITTGFGNHSEFRSFFSQWFGCDPLLLRNVQ